MKDHPVYLVTNTDEEGNTYTLGVYLLRSHAIRSAKNVQEGTNVFVSETDLRLTASSYLSPQFHCGTTVWYKLAGQEAVEL